MAQDDPCHGDEPDSVQAVQDVRLVLGRYLEKDPGVLVSAEAQQKFL
jgi:hypothetical protein